MNSGLLFCFLGALSFGLLGCASKLAERRNCQASLLVVYVFAWATLVMLVRSAGLPSPLSLPFKAAVVAIVCGVCAAVAYYAFQSSIQVGKVSVAWLMMNISSAIPAVVSVFAYKERFSAIKVLALGLVLIALFLIYQGRQTENQLEAQSVKGEEQAKWFLLMIVVLLTNGMSAFGLKVIVAWGLPETSRYPYLTVWYAAGLLSIGIPILIKGARFGARELGWGGVLAALSMGGQVSMAVALNRGAPGHIVFPVAIGGSVFIVILGGRLLFGEHMNKLTASGVFFGLAAVVLLGAG